MTFSYNKIFIPILSLLAISIAACKHKTDAKAKSGAKPNNLAAEAYLVTLQSFENNYAASGSLLPNEELEIHPEVSGRVTSISFKEGSFVRKGQTLIQLYNEDLAAQVQKLRAQRQLQVKIQERQKELVNIGGISQQDYETTQTQIKSIDADIAYAQAQLRTTKIIAPFDGQIGIRNISQGAIVSPSTLITTLKQIHPLKMDFMVPDQYRKHLQNGKKVYFSVTGSTDTFSGQINAIDPGADVNTRTVRVRAIVPNPDGLLTAGSFASVIVPFEIENSAILVPSQAVIPTSRNKKVALIKNGKATLVDVELGSRTSDRIEVVKGLQAGDTVITTGLMQVRAGMEVKVTKLGS